jgi:hypothetical protein
MSNRRLISIVAVMAILTTALVARSRERIATSGLAEVAIANEADGRLTDRDRQRLEEAGPAVVKTFIAALRTRFNDAPGAPGASELRRFIAPRYLKKHRLEKGAFPIGRVVTKDIFDNQLSDDPQTAVIVAETEDAAKEVFVFRTTVYEGGVYILPLSPPDPTTKSFKPWILRIKL